MGLIRGGLFMSLDGVVEADDTWQFPYFDEDLFVSLAASWARSDAALMGRRSYEGYRALREHHPDSPMVAFLERADRYVVSTSMVDPGWPGTTVLSHDAFTEVARLRDVAVDTEVLVPGSPSIVRALLAHRLLDELTVTLLPIVVGGGTRLFPEESSGPDPIALSLSSSRSYTSGAVELVYFRAEG